MRYGIERGVGRHAESGRRERAGGGFTIEEAPPRVTALLRCACVLRVWRAPRRRGLRSLGA